MEMNLKRKVKEIKLASKNFLQPLFELIVNAIQSIEEKKNTNGKITITIIRDKSQIRLIQSHISDFPIESFIVEDNGIGFNNESFESFNTVYTQRKAGAGGKGVGRLTILKAFKQMEVQSSYKDEGGYHSRSFTFDLENEIKEKDKNGFAKEETGSVIIARHYQDSFKEHTKISLDHVAQEIVEHLLLYFISENTPDIHLQEEKGQEVKSLKDVFKESFDNENKTQKHLEGEEKFTTYVVDKKSGNEKKSAPSGYRLCAHKRKVKTGWVSTIFPFFPEDKCIYIYVTGDYLDKNVNELRDELAIPQNNESSSGEISQETISQIICTALKKGYASEIEEYERSSRRKLKEYISSRAGIEYIGLKDDEDALKKISPKLINSQNKLDEELHKVLRAKRQALREQLEVTLDARDISKISPSIENLLSENHKLNYGQLGEYMIRRHLCIRLLKKGLEHVKGTEAYEHEKYFHSIFFPMGKDSVDLQNSDHNLWLIDDRYTFFSYAASDFPINKHKSVQSDSSKRPDIALYDRREVYKETDRCDDLRALAIFEFKRPGTNNDNITDVQRWIEQAKSYVTELQGGGVKTDSGAKYTVEKNTLKFVHIIIGHMGSALTETLLNNNFIETPFGSCVYAFPRLALSIQVLDYKTLIQNAEERHEAFFRKLGISLSSNK